VSDFSKRATPLAKRLAPALDDTLQHDIAVAEWEHPMEVQASKGKINIVYFEEHEDGIFDTEYGSVNQSPSAVIRPFIESSAKVISEAIQSEALDFLFAEGILP
jgi:hypothetical protein